MILHYDITHIPQDVVKLAAKYAAVTKEIEKDLNSTEVKAAELYCPESAAAIELIKEALLDCDKLVAGVVSVVTSRGVQARLQALGSDLVKLEHDSTKHGVSYYIRCFEIVFNDLFGAVKDTVTEVSKA